MAGRIHPEITTDTKMIPITIEKHLRNGHDITEAFRLAVNEFEGSHAISMHTDLAPGKIFFAQKGSGQAIFIGCPRINICRYRRYTALLKRRMPISNWTVKRSWMGKMGPTQGQIFVLDPTNGGGLAGITAAYYDGTTINLTKKDVKVSEITSRDIDRQDFAHYFLKEINEAPRSVEQTLQARWTTDPDHNDRYIIALDEKAFPQTIRERFYPE